jgi:hypothetical protein
VPMCATAFLLNQLSTWDAIRYSFRALIRLGLCTESKVPGRRWNGPGRGHRKVGFP